MTSESSRPSCLDPCKGVRREACDAFVGLFICLILLPTMFLLRGVMLKSTALSRA